MSSSYGATVLKLRFCFIQIQFINQVRWLGGRITESSPAASRKRWQQPYWTLHKIQNNYMVTHIDMISFARKIIFHL
jgi:hypothetical protein